MNVLLLLLLLVVVYNIILLHSTSRLCITNCECTVHLSLFGSERRGSCDYQVLSNMPQTLATAFTDNNLPNVLPMVLISGLVPY